MSKLEFIGVVIFATVMLCLAVGSVILFFREASFNVSKE